ncbi:hypothetical protein N7456_007617 [Penicillium angulare]|uniref:Uncharacterized protein n=1 Tax=Penicillium angulare TaxID=116970 RepID=A0A9W9FB61_9EURO|nr:hypothetical protein N7456_007617 [Penicillium angulare]
MPKQIDCWEDRNKRQPIIVRIADSVFKLGKFAKCGAMGRALGHPRNQSSDKDHAEMETVEAAWTKCIPAMNRRGTFEAQKFMDSESNAQDAAVGRTFILDY